MWSEDAARCCILQGAVTLPLVHRARSRVRANAGWLTSRAREPTADMVRPGAWSSVRGPGYRVAAVWNHGSLLHE